MSHQDLRIKLMELQIQALRSVLSEYGCKYETDHSEFTQWHAAEALERVLEVIK